MGFLECLSDPTLQIVFIQFCAEREGEESNVLFWLDADDFLRHSGGARAIQFETLAEKYFASNSPQQLRLFDASYQEKLRTTTDPAAAVKAAQDVVFLHLEQQVYPQFVSSPKYAAKSTNPETSTTDATNSPDSTTAASTENVDDTYALSKRSSVYNRYGQKVVGDAKSPEPEEKRKAASAVERSREGKWIRMVASWQEFSTKNPRKLSSRIRKGIPDALRARAWELMLESNQPENEARYKALLQSVADSENRDVIDRDVNRTFSDYVFFRQKEGQSPSQGREALRNVLRAYACHDKELGYCQGMSFHAGVFLMYATEEQAFWMLESLLRNPRWQLRGMFLPGFPLLNEYYFILESLMKEHTPKLRQKLLKFEVATAMFAQEWFMTLFACCIPFESFLRVMDILLYKGYKILFQLAIAMLKSIEQASALPTMDFATLLLSLKGLGGRDKYRENTYAVMDTDALLKAAFQISVSTAKIDKLREARKSISEK